MKTNPYYVFSILLLLISTLVKGQSFEKCQIISSNRDTTNLYVKITSDGNVITYYPSSTMFDASNGSTIYLAGNKTYILVKKEKGQKKPEKLFIEPYEIIIYKGKEFHKLYVKHPSASGKMFKFLPKIIDGEVSLFRHDYLINGMYPKKRFYLTRNGRTKDVNKSGFKTDMSQYFNEDKELSEMIKSKQLKIRDIELITKKFNETKAKKTYE